MLTSKKYLLDKVKIAWDVALSQVGHMHEVSHFPSKISLWDVYQLASGNIFQDDEWMELGIWALYQSLDSLHKNSLSEECNIVSIEGVTLDLFDSMMSANLADESWSDERTVWDALPTRLN